MQSYYRAYFIDGIRDSKKLYDTLFTVDYGVGNGQDELYIDLSFTFLHWKIAESLKYDPDFNITSINKKEAKLLCLNIFPQGNTVLHFLFNEIDDVKYLYEYIEDGNKTEKIPIQIPFIKNF